MGFAGEAAQALQHRRLPGGGKRITRHRRARALLLVDKCPLLGSPTQPRLQTWYFLDPFWCVKTATTLNEPCARFL